MIETLTFRLRSTVSQALYNKNCLFQAHQDSRCESDNEAYDKWVRGVSAGRVVPFVYNTSFNADGTTSQ